MRVAGRERSEGVYTIHDRIVPEEMCRIWNLGLEEFQKKNWAQAGERFANVAANVPLLSKMAECYLKHIAGEPVKGASLGEAGEIVLAAK